MRRNKAGVHSSPDHGMRASAAYLGPMRTFLPLLAIAVAACVRNPATGKMQLNLISESQEWVPSTAVFHAQKQLPPGFCSLVGFPSKYAGFPQGAAERLAVLHIIGREFDRLGGFPGADARRLSRCKERRRIRPPPWHCAARIQPASFDFTLDPLRRGRFVRGPEERRSC